MVVKIAKFEKYPEDSPTGIAVGFTLVFKNRKSEYIDTIVDLNLSEEEALIEAWKKLEDRVETLKQTIGSLPNLIGSTFTPPTVATPVNPEDLPGPGVIVDEVEPITEEVEPITEEVETTTEEEIIEE